MTPVPTMAMRRMGLSSDMLNLLYRLDGLGFLRVCDTCEVALPGRDHALVGSVEPSGVHRAGKIGDEHAVVANVEGDADTFAQVTEHDFMFRADIDGRAVDGVAVRRIAAVGPIEHAMLLVNLEIDRLR